MNARRDNTWVFGKEAPSANVKLPASGHVTAVEICTFIPNCLRSRDVIRRVANNGLSPQIISNMVNYHRMWPKWPLLPNSLRITTHNIMREAFQGWTFRTQQAALDPTWDAASTTLAGFRTRCEDRGEDDLLIENIPFHHLATYVYKMPQDDDARDLTRCVEYAIQNPHAGYLWPQDFTSLTQLLGGPLPIQPEHTDAAAATRWRHAHVDGTMQDLNDLDGSDHKQSENLSDSEDIWDSTEEWDAEDEITGEQDHAEMNNYASEDGTAHNAGHSHSHDEVEGKQMPSDDNAQFTSEWPSQQRGGSVRTRPDCSSKEVISASGLFDPRMEEFTDQPNNFEHNPEPDVVTSAYYLDMEFDDHGIISQELDGDSNTSGRDCDTWVGTSDDEFDSFDSQLDLSLDIPQSYIPMSRFPTEGCSSSPHSPFDSDDLRSSGQATPLTQSPLEIGLDEIFEEVFNYDLYQSSIFGHN
ncbi:hypothetical protein P153DRAFT_387305 [Dothidotthia symphoricarpi CBS 119687]|uniref:Uncharacterized protein n=1 Tax=Dothidotthia symphoricarpi CBS 119687 TaxID=1392245 RepID=A0A6A6A8R0_9PLEO|nr:uncharacterized protein P153DRAFT_387305 [Dothidotthia symphoricarpi CBS 119687]KAF2127563.1 hypothetical protein P153DRAFT_387305 [Dothidotthia symphoricarpi CBS 119687]